MEFFERAAEAGARILKVERLPQGRSSDEGVARSLVFVFDVGRVLAEIDPGSGALVTRPVEGVDAADGWVAADEEDPWWRLLGHPLVRCRVDEQGAQLQFRADEESPRTLTLAVEDRHLRVSMRAAPLPA